MRINFELNGKSVLAEVLPHQPLRDILRSQFDLTGVKVGCHSGRCGVCSVLLDDRVVKSCLLMAPKANGRSIVTIEGLSNNGELHPVQQAFKDNFALQCGYCTPGFIMATVDYLSSSPSNPPLRDEIKTAIKGNVCRCTGYEKIISAISSAIISSEN